MNTSDALHRLAALQDRIVACIGESCTLVRQDGVAGHGELAQRRWMMMRLLREYQLFKHIEVFDPAIMSGNLAQAETARRMKHRCTAEGDDFKRYVTCWSSQAIAMNWDDYASALLAMSERLLAHIDRERHDVEGLLAGSASTRRPGRG